jgi:hypothetical protein
MIKLSEWGVNQLFDIIRDKGEKMVYYNRRFYKKI